MSIGISATLDLAFPEMGSKKPFEQEEPPPEPTPPTEVELVDQDGNRFPGQCFVLEVDGVFRSGVTDKEGKAKVDLPADGKFPSPHCPT